MNIADAIKEIIPTQDKTLIIATIESPPPALKLKYAEQIIYPEQIYCSNYLLQEYHRDYKLKGIIDKEHQDVSEYTFQDMQIGVSASDMTLAGQGPHKHSITSVGGGGTQGKASGTIESTGNYEHHGDLWFTDTLKKGDGVLVAIVGVFYVVVTKITKMPNKALGGV